jgi:UDP-N-acetylmuramoyl-L-alanyl-D-glutamate--2,6-diaminopimelate ligase
MKLLKEILTDEKIIYGNQETTVEGITNNSKEAKKNYAFFAVKGTSVDGHNFIDEAIKNGASVIFIEDERYIENLKGKNITVVLTGNGRKSLALASNKFYDNPSEKLKVIAITGTNGKTTTSNLLAQYYEMAGYKVGVIGTINYRIGDEIISSGHTTPDPVEWFKTLKVMKDKGADVVVAEVSSHAADQYRVYSTKFHGGIFTNQTQDHLDYHQTMENYFLAKRKIFEQIDEFNKEAIYSINVDDEYGRRILDFLKNYLKVNDDKIITYGKTSKDFKILDYRLSLFETEFSYKYKDTLSKIKTKFRGVFNIYNLSAAVSFLVKDGFDLKFLEEKALHLKPIKGRFEVIEGQGLIVVIDYAHTPDALENILKSLNEIKENRIITVFGAGGDRDKTKRPLMGETAERLSDIVILTSDNPRNEDPLSIIEDILDGIKDKDKSITIVDRKQAIEKAISLAKEKDIILIAGKGHENYQIIGDKILHFDDAEVVKEIIDGGEGV